MNVLLQQIQSLPVIGRSKSASNWVAAFTGTDFGCVAPTVHQAVGCLVRYELGGTFREDGRYPGSKRELLELFPPPAANRRQNESALGQFCIDNAERLGISFSVEKEEVKIGYRPLLASDRS